MTTYNALNFPNVPEIPGTKPCHYIYGHTLTRDHTIPKPNIAKYAAEYVGSLPMEPGMPIFLDIEYHEEGGRVIFDFRQDIRKKRPGETVKQCCEAVRADMELQADIVLAVKAACPGHPVIPYAGLCIEDPQAALWGDWQGVDWCERGFTAWQVAQAFIAGTRLREAVDGVLVPLFTVDDRQWMGGEWERSATHSIEQAMGWGKPVYAQLCPIYKNRWAFVPDIVVNRQHQFCEEQGVHIVNWASGYARTPPVTWQEAVARGMHVPAVAGGGVA